MRLWGLLLAGVARFAAPRLAALSYGDRSNDQASDRVGPPPGLVASIPFLRRLYRRYHTWRAPDVAIGVFVAGFVLSALVISPAIRGSDTPAKPSIQQPSNHAGRWSAIACFASTTRRSAFRHRLGSRAGPGRLSRPSNLGSTA